MNSEMEMNSMKSNKHNDWYERGELPPINAKCLANYLPNAVMDNNERVDDGHCIIRGYSGGMVWVQWREGDNFVDRVVNFEFRPIPTELDVLVNECVKVLGDGALSGEVKSLRDQAELLVGKGWRPVKEQNEEAFIQDILSLMNLNDYTTAEQIAFCLISRKAYRHGCRFIEQEEK